MHMFAVYDYRSSKNLSLTIHRAPHIFLNTQWLQITVSSSRMEPSDCALMPACRVWLSFHLLLSTYPLLGTYLLTTYTYKCMHLLTGIYGMCSIPILYLCALCELHKQVLVLLPKVFTEALINEQNFIQARLKVSAY